MSDTEQFVILPPGCAIEKGRRQLPVGELRQYGIDRQWCYSGSGRWEWKPVPRDSGGLAIGSDVVSRKIEKGRT